MELNSLLYQPTSSHQRFTLNSYLFLPRRFPAHYEKLFKISSSSDRDLRVVLRGFKDEPNGVPCLYFCQDSAKAVLYFHAAGQDLSNCKSLCQQMSNRLKVNVLAMQYKGFGIYKGSPNDEEIATDSQIVYQWLRSNFEVFLAGRSLGSGVALNVALKYGGSGVVLISSFKSIRRVVQRKVGKLLSLLIKDRYEIQTLIPKVKCKMLFVHGRQDEVSPCSDIEQMRGLSELVQVVVNESMRHDQLDFQEHLLTHLQDFIY